MQPVTCTHAHSITINRIISFSASVTWYLCTAPRFPSARACSLKFPSAVARATASLNLVYICIYLYVLFVSFSLQFEKRDWGGGGLVICVVASATRKKASALPRSLSMRSQARARHACSYIHPSINISIHPSILSYFVAASAGLDFVKNSTASSNAA